MDNEINRRKFLGVMPAALGVAASALRGNDGPLAHVAGAMRASEQSNVTAAAVTTRLEPFDYNGVKLLPSRWQRQYEDARNTYLSISDDDILHGFRAEAGLPAPGKVLGGWAQQNSDIVFGQWLSGMARGYRATGDVALRDKAMGLVAEWVKTIKPDGDARMDHYAFDKLVCGLVDLDLYAGAGDTVRPVLERVTAAANRTFQRPPANYDPTSYAAPIEWYTLSENLYRAYLLTGEQQFKDFAQLWHYPRYWNLFASTSSPNDAHGVHAYSHVNTFSSAAAAYEVTGDPRYLAIIKNFYDYMQHAQCYATGGYGPNETFCKVDGSLGASLDTRSDTCETGCGSWAVYKLSRYLQRFTGDARYGDWAERMFYNGAGAGLHVTAGGKAFYYADYRVGGGMKVYNWDTFTCCSGTYFQDVADFHNLGYYKDAHGIYVNMYIPSELTWTGPHGPVTFTQHTRYPDDERATLTVHTATPSAFAIRFRIPEWTRGASVRVNGAPVHVAAEPGTWATVQRTWSDGDTVEVHIPLTLRMLPVDKWHPNRVAVVRGPTVLVLEGAYHAPHFRLPDSDAELSSWLVPEPWKRASGILTRTTEPEDEQVTVFRVALPDHGKVRTRFRPFYDVAEGYPYFMYFDREKLPRALW
ncbi:MAG TPA: beta-L-arabinofuranosidase domain-containing protein [Gemmatimonadaceae bacterium]|nr:beta-L-arabinofuranosidase domain-containing protein [Gemmatimonadaceae bacterium]